MSIYEYPDLWFPGGYVEMEAMVDPHFLHRQHVNSPEPPRRGKLDQILEKITSFLERFDRVALNEKKEGT